MAKPLHAVRKPSRASFDADDSVTGANLGAPLSRRSQVPDRRGKIRVGRDGVERARVHAWIPVQLERQLAVYCAQQDRELGDVVADALTKLLGRERPNKRATNV